MEQEKDLLRKVLCEMLPYGVICNCVDPNFSGSVDWTLYAINLQDDTIQATNGDCTDEFDFLNVKPYLRPMKNMTVVERKDLRRLTDAISINNDGLEFESHDGYNDYIGYCFCSEIVDWLNAHHFDYRDLIPMGLALEAPEGMYKTK